LGIGKKHIFSTMTWLLSFGVHMGATAFSYASYMAYILSKRYFVLITLASLILLIFFYNLYSDTLLIRFDLLLGEYYQLEHARFISLDRALGRKTMLTPSLAVQVFFAILLPLLIVMYRYYSGWLSNDFFLGYVVAISLIVMVMYLELSLARRFFVIPIISLLFFLRLKDLQILAAIKVFLFLGFSHNMY